MRPRLRRVIPAACAGLAFRGGLLGGLDILSREQNLIPLATGRPDGVLSVLAHSREDTWDRRASVLGFWVSTGFG